MDPVAQAGYTLETTLLCPEEQTLPTVSCCQDPLYSSWGAPTPSKLVQWPQPAGREACVVGGDSTAVNPTGSLLN